MLEGGEEPPHPEDHPPSQPREDPPGQPTRPQASRAQRSRPVTFVDYQQWIALERSFARAGSGCGLGAEGALLLLLVRRWRAMR